MKTLFFHSRGCLVRSFAPLLLLLFLPGLCHAFDWEISTLEPGKWFDHMGSRSLVFDSSDRPQIAYGGRDLYNAWYDGSKWQTMVVDTGPGVGRRASIALPPGSSSTCIGYMDEPNGHVKCAQWVSGDFFPFTWHWRIETVADAATDRSITVAASNLGEPRLLFFTPSGHLRYAYRESNLWYFETIYLNSASDTQNYADMMIDSSGRVHVVFSRRYQPLIYARRELNGTWTQSTFGAAEFVNVYPALALDSANRPHVVYARNQLPSDSLPSYLVYTHFDGVAWPEEPITASETRSVATDISVAMRNGILHVSYFDPDAKNLAYVNVTAGTSQTVDSGTNSGWHSSIAITASGVPAISYYDKEELKYGSFGTPAWSVNTLDQARSVPEGFSLAADASGAMHATWVDTLQQHLRYARQNGTNWQIISLAGGATADTSLKLSSNGYPRVTFYNSVSNVLRYSAFLKGDVGSIWKTETIDTGGGFDNSLAIASDDWSWISYGAGGNLKCAYQNTNGWNLLTVDNTTGGYIFGTSIALAPNGTPSIAYGRLGVLMWAYSHWYRGVLLWNKEIVATNYDVAVQPTLFYSGDGLPCIGFAEDVRGARFAWRDGTGWRVQDVDPSQWTSSCAYGMDDAGRHYLVYKSEKDDFLRHAFGYGDLTNQTWRVQTIQPSQSFLSHGVSLIVRDSEPRMVFPGDQFSGRDVLYARGLPLRITNISRKGGALELQWSGETNGVELQSRSKVDTTRWAVKAHNLSGTNYSISPTNPAAFYRLRLE